MCSDGVVRVRDSFAPHSYFGKREVPCAASNFIDYELSPALPPTLKLVRRTAMALRRTRDLHEFTIAATDADIGKIHDLYLDDRDWTIRYIVVQLGEVLAGPKVLISPNELKAPVWMPLHVMVSLTWGQVESSPDVELHKPVSRQDRENETENGGPGAHLRSTREVIGYHIMATDGEIGHIEDFLFDDDTWKIRYAVADTSNWWDGRRVLLKPEWIESVRWPDRKIEVNMSREKIKNSPEWDPDQPLSREYELRLHTYYGGEPYWTEES